MDDLEAVWGPDGRATVDPTSVQRTWTPPQPTEPRPTTTTTHELAGPPAEDVVPPTRRWGPKVAIHPVLLVGMTVLIALLSTVALRLGRPDEAPPPVDRAEPGATATTIVSAAADLLGRSTTTTLYSGSNEPLPPTTAPAPTTTSPTPAPSPPSRPVPARSDADLAGAERAARAFVDVMARRDCDELFALLSAGTRELLEPGREELCQSFATEDIPAIRVDGPARPTVSGVVVPLVSGADREDLHLLLEDGRWLVDLLEGVSSDA